MVLSNWIVCWLHVFMRRRVYMRADFPWWYELFNVISGRELGAEFAQRNSTDVDHIRCCCVDAALPKPIFV